MIPALFPIILILYGEFSKDVNTRFLGRVLFYTYTLSLILPQYASTQSFSLVSSWLIFVFGIGYCIVRCRNVVSIICFVISATCLTLNTWSLYLQDYGLLLSLPFYADWSHLIIRESILVGLASFAVWKPYTKDRDWNLVAYTFMLVCLESLIV